MLMPVYGFVEGDTLGLLVLAHDTDTASVLMDRMRRSARPRVPPLGEGFIEFEGRELAPDETLLSVGVGPLSRVDLKLRRDLAPGADDA